MIAERLDEAYETLIEPASRMVYDRILRASKVTGMAGGTPVPRPHLDGRRTPMPGVAIPSAGGPLPPSAGVPVALGPSTRPPPAASTAPASPREQARALAEQAEAAVRRSDMVSALELYQQACDLDPRSEYLVAHARLMLKNPQWVDRALQRLQQVVEVDPTCSEAWVEVAEVWRRRGHTERQRKALERALAADPAHPRASRMYADLVGEGELESLRRRARSD
jgi:tetratricopeptide (TPR) repeat protein